MNFAHAIAICGRDGTYVVSDAIQARDFLMEAWPTERGPRHRDALETCLKVIDGHRSIVDAEEALRLAAEEAGILADAEPRIP